MKWEYESLDDVVKEVTGKKCIRCEEPIGQSMEIGLYVVCQNCGYRNSLRKLLKEGDNNFS